MDFQYLNSEHDDCKTNGCLLIPTIALHLNNKEKFSYISIVFRFLSMGIGFRFYKI